MTRSDAILKIAALLQGRNHIGALADRAAVIIAVIALGVASSQVINSNARNEGVVAGIINVVRIAAVQMSLLLDRNATSVQTDESQKKADSTNSSAENASNKGLSGWIVIFSLIGYMGYLVRQNRICCEVENESYFIACLLVNDLGALPCENAAASVERLTSTSKHKDFFRKATKTSRMAVIEMLLSELGIDDNENESIAFLSVDLPFGIKARINTVAIHNATRRLPDRRDVIQ